MAGLGACFSFVTVGAPDLRFAGTGRLEGNGVLERADFAGAGVAGAVFQKGRKSKNDEEVSGSLTGLGRGTGLISGLGFC